VPFILREFFYVWPFDEAVAVARKVADFKLNNPNARR